jgi:hypothetical protein
MSKVKVIVALFLAALAVTAVVSASASAAEWFVAGKALGTGSKATLTSKAVVDEAAVLNVPGLEIKISCSGLSGTNPEIIGKDAGQATALTFESCSESSPAACKLSSPTVVTEPITALVSKGTGTDDRVNFKPKTGKTFATLTFTGETCSLRGEKGVNGQVLTDAPTGQTELASQTLSGLGSVENVSLEIGGNHAYIEKGRALLKLTSGSAWSFH